MLISDICNLWHHLKCFFEFYVLIGDIYVYLVIFVIWGVIFPFYQVHLPSNQI